MTPLDQEKMRKNIFLYAFESVFAQELDLTKDVDRCYTDPHTASVFHTYTRSIADRFLSPEKLAEEICSVQPMPSDTYGNLMDAALKDEDIPAGYKAVPAFPGAVLLTKLVPIE